MRQKIDLPKLSVSSRPSKWHQECPCGSVVSFIWGRGCHKSVKNTGTFTPSVNDQILQNERVYAADDLKCLFWVMWHWFWAACVMACMISVSLYNNWMICGTTTDCLLSLTYKVYGVEVTRVWDCLSIHTEIVPHDNFIIITAWREEGMDFWSCPRNCSLLYPHCGG